MLPEAAQARSKGEAMRFYLIVINLEEGGKQDDR
jgi:hypothetical protein